MEKRDYCCVPRCEASRDDGECVLSTTFRLWRKLNFDFAQTTFWTLITLEMLHHGLGKTGKFAVVDAIPTGLKLKLY